MWRRAAPVDGSDPPFEPATSDVITAADALAVRHGVPPPVFRPRRDPRDAALPTRTLLGSIQSIVESLRIVLTMLS